MSERKLSQLSSFPLVFPKLLNIEQKIQFLDEHINYLEENLTWCELCRIKLISIFHAKTHYVSHNHGKILKDFKDRELEMMYASPYDYYCKVCRKICHGDPDVKNSHLNSGSHKRLSERYCFLCDIRTKSREALKDHETKSTSHKDKMNENISAELSKTTCITPKFEDQFNIPRVCVTPKKQPQVGASKALSYCEVCNTDYSPEQLQAHLLGFAHHTMQRFKAQFSEEIVEIFSVAENKNDLFCHLCNVTMMGLGGVNLHINSVKHVKKFRNKFPTADGKAIEANIDKPASNGSSNNQWDPSESLDKTQTARKLIEAQIFEQVEKLVDTLYYSKTVPFDVALNYLKKINCEVAGLKETYQKKSTSAAQLFSPKEKRLNDQKVVNPVQTTYKIEDVTPGEAGCENKEDGRDEALLEKPPDLASMYLNIANLKDTLTESGPEEDVLDEIKCLLQSVLLTEGPLEDLLIVLQRFNADLDSEVSKFKDKFSLS